MLQLTPEKENNLRFFLKMLSATTRISSFLYDENMNIVSSYTDWENQIRNFFLLNCPLDLNILLHTEDEQLIAFSDRMNLCWIVQPMPGMECLLVLGPAVESDLTFSYLQKQLSFKNMSVSSRMAFMKMTRDIPVISFPMFMHYGTMLHYGIYEKICQAKFFEDLQNTEASAGDSFEEERLAGERIHKRSDENGRVEEAGFLGKEAIIAGKEAEKEDITAGKEAEKEDIIAGKEAEKEAIIAGKEAEKEDITAGTAAKKESIIAGIETENRGKSYADEKKKVKSGSSRYSAEDKIRSIPGSHGSRTLEMQMLADVRNGVLKEEPDFDNLHMTEVGILSQTDPLRQARNLIITQITTVTRAAVDGGMDPESAYSLSDYYIQKLETLETVQEVYRLSVEMVRTFTQAVIDAKAENYSGIVKYLRGWISKHADSDIRLQELGERIGYDPYYIAKLFHEETGQTIKSFILEKKTEQAQILLRTTLLSIQEISDRLSFGSAAYFATCFKKQTGMSPAQYRKQIEE